MATSGSVDFTVTADDIITDALKVTNVLKIGQTASTDQITDGLHLLNLLVKAWQTDGLQLWARDRATLFLEKDKNTYNLGPSGDNATLAFVSTTLADDAAASDTSLTVASITGISNSDNIGIILDDGNIHWTTVNGAPSGTTVVITTGLPSAAASGKIIYAYTTKINRPLKIWNMYRRTADNLDTPIILQSLNEYSEQTNKLSDGTPLTATYDPQLTDGRLYIWPEADDLTLYIQFWFHRPFEDFDLSTHNPDFPQEWYLALVYGLATFFADIYDIDPRLSSRITKRAVNYKDSVLDWDTEDTSIFFSPDLTYQFDR